MPCTGMIRTLLFVIFYDLAELSAVEFDIHLAGQMQPPRWNERGVQGTKKGRRTCCKQSSDSWGIVCYREGQGYHQARQYVSLGWGGSIRILGLNENMQARSC